MSFRDAVRRNLLFYRANYSFKWAQSVMADPDTNVILASSGLIFKTELTGKRKLPSSQSHLIVFYWTESHQSSSSAWLSGVICIWVSVSLKYLIIFGRQRFDLAPFVISASYRAACRPRGGISEAEKWSLCMHKIVVSEMKCALMKLRLPN